MKKRRFAYVYSLYKELEGDGVKFETTNKNASLISYTIKLVEDSTYLMKTFVVSDVFLDNLTKIYDRKNIFVQNGNECLTYKFNIRKLYFEKIIKNDGSKNFHNFIYDEISYTDPTKLLPAFFNNQVSAIKEARTEKISHCLRKSINAHFRK